MTIPEGWQKADRPWSEYPIGTKARQSWEGGYWIKTEHGWKWHNGATFPRPGAADQVMLAAAPTPPAQEDEPVAWFDENDLTRLHESGFAVNVLASNSKGGCCNIPLYTRPDNDGLRKAVDNFLEVFDKTDPEINAYLYDAIQALIAESAKAK